MYQKFTHIDDKIKNINKAQQSLQTQITHGVLLDANPTYPLQYREHPGPHPESDLTDQTSECSIGDMHSEPMVEERVTQIFHFGNQENNPGIHQMPMGQPGMSSLGGGGGPFGPSMSMPQQSNPGQNLNYPQEEDNVILETIEDILPKEEPVEDESEDEVELAIEDDEDNIEDYEEDEVNEEVDETPEVPELPVNLMDTSNAVAEEYYEESNQQEVDLPPSQIIMGGIVDVLENNDTETETETSETNVSSPPTTPLVKKQNKSKTTDYPKLSAKSFPIGYETTLESDLSQVFVVKSDKVGRKRWYKKKD